MLLSRSGETEACKSALSSSPSASVTMFEEKRKLPFEQHCSCSNPKIFWLNYMISVVFESREMSDSEAHMDESSSEPYGPRREDAGHNVARPRGIHGSDLYMPVAPYPPHNPTREHALVLPAEHIVVSLETRITVLETQIKALQDTVDNWEQWYYQWNPLFRFLHWMFGFMLQRN